MRTSIHNIGIIIGYFLAAVACLIILYYILKKYGDWLALPIALSPIAFSIAVIYCLVRLEQKRKIMKAITGADFQDNEWGFGQVIAIFLWVPLLVQTLYWAIGKYPLILLCAWMCLLKVERDKPPADTSPEVAIESGDNSQDIDETG
jgi:hypothetical protein